MGAKLFIKKLRMGSSLWYILRVVQLAKVGKTVKKERANNISETVPFLCKIIILLTICDMTFNNY